MTGAAGPSLNEYANVYITAANEVIADNTQVILTEYLEIGSGFDYELAYVSGQGGTLEILGGEFPGTGISSGVDASGGYLEILLVAQ